MGDARSRRWRRCSSTGCLPLPDELREGAVSSGSR